MSKYSYRCLLAICLAAGLPACVTSPAQQKTVSAEELALGRASVVTSGVMKLDPAKPSTLSWKSPIEVFGGDDLGQLQDLKQITQAAVQRQISRKDYPLLSVGGDFQMNAIVILDNDKASADEKHADLLGKAGVDPGLTGSSLSRGKGSLVIELRQGYALRWRGAVQIYILPEHSVDVVAQRIEYAVAQLLSTWP